MKSRFEHISPTDYDVAAVLVREVGDSMLACLDLVALKPMRIVEVGCGAGYCTQLLHNRYPTAEVVAIDDSLQMLAYAKTLPSLQASWLCTSLDKLPLTDHSVDLVVSNLFLPWCREVITLLPEWQRVLRPGGLLMFSTFGPDTLQELQGQPISLLHLVDMHNLGDALLQAGFDDPVLNTDYFTLTYKKLQQLQNELQLTGFISRQEVLVPLEKNTAGVIPLTYEIVYGHAWKPELSKNEEKAGIVKVPLAHLRGRKTV